MIVPFLLALLILLAMVYLTRDFWSRARDQEELREQLAQPQVSTLEYVPQPGQDPAVVVAALNHEGFDAVVDTTGDRQLVLVSCPAGLDRDRAHVRAVIAASGSAIQDAAPTPQPVRFEDE